MGNLGTMVVRLALELKRYKDELRDAVRDTHVQMTQAQRSTSGLTAETKKLDQQAGSAASQFGKLERAVNSADFSRASSGLAGLVGNAGRLALITGLGAALTFVGAASVRLAGDLVPVQRQFDVLNSSMVTVAGGSKAAAREMAWIKPFAATTPFQLGEVTSAFVKLKGLGLDATEGSLRSFGNTASAMGKNVNQMIEAVADAATGEFERLKEFGIRAKVEGDSVQFTFQGMTTTVRNSAAEITGYLKALGDVNFAGAMAERAATLDGVLSNTADSWDRFVLSVSQAGVSDAIGNTARAATNDLNVLADTLEQAKLKGDGFFKSMANAAGVTIGRSAFGLLQGSVNLLNGSLNTLTGGVIDLNSNLDLMPDNLKPASVQMELYAGKVKQAEAEYAALSARLAQVPDNIYIKSDLNNLARYIAALRLAREEQRALMGGGAAEAGPVGSVGSGDTALARAQRADYDRRKEALDGFMGKYATDGEKMAQEIKKQKALLGDLYSPEVEARIREHYIKPVRGASAATKAATAAEKERTESAERESGFRQKVIEAELRWTVEAAKASNEAFDEYFAGQEKDRLAGEARIKTAREMLDALQFETALLGMNTQEREVATAMRELERAGVVKGTEAYEAYAEAIRQGVVDKATQQEGLAFWKSVDQTAHDVFVSVADEGEDAFKKIGKTIKSAVLDMLYQMTVKKWIIQISGQGGAGTGGGTNWLDMASKAYDAYTGGSAAASAGTITNGMTQAQMLSAQTAGMGTTAATTSTAAAGTSGAATTAAAGTGTASAGAAAGGASTATAVAGYAAWIYAAYQLADSFYERGYNKEAVKDSAVYNASGEKGLYQMMKALGMSEKMANIWSGTTRMATLFGRRLKEAGMQGQFTGDGGIDVANYQYYKGGVFRSNKRVTSEMSDGRAESFEQQLRNTQASAAAMARAMGASSEAVEAWVGKININLKGLSDSEAAAKIAEELDKLRGRMIAAVPELGMSAEMFVKHLGDVNAAIEGVGMGAGTIASVITDGMLGRLSTAQVGEQLSDIIIGGIYNSLAGGFAAQISNVFTQQIIQPVMTAVLAGVPISAAISQQAINTVVATAQGAAAQLSAIISNPAFRAAIASIQSAISSVASISTSSAKHVKSYGSAASASALAAKQAADEQRRAAQAVKDAWQSATDSILEEMRRLRAEILGESPAGEAYAQAQFAIATAQARAGDQAAAERLPELSQALVELATVNAASLSDLRVTQGATLASLAETRRILAVKYGLALPAFADGGMHSGGLRLVGERGPEIEATGAARYYSAEQTRGMLSGSGDTAALEALLERLVAKVDGLRGPLDGMKDKQRETFEVLDKWTQGGRSGQVRVLTS